MKIVTLQHKDSAVFNYRFQRPIIDGLGGNKQKKLLKENEEIQLGELAKRWKKKADVVVIKYIDHRHTLDVLYTLRNIGGFKVVIDIDDNLWQIPIDNPNHGTLKQFSNRAIMLIESIKAADWVTVSTENLKAILEPINSNIEVLPNYIDPSEWKFKRKKHKKVRIGWVWSPTHIPDMPEVAKALKKISQRGDVEIVIFGTEKDIFDFPTTNIKGVKYTEYPRVFMEEGIDISIAPLANNEFNKAKSNIKWLESTMAGAAFIGSNVYPYEFSVKDGKTGYLAKNTSQWIKKMTYLIENPEKRAEMVKNAKKEVLEKYSLSNLEKWRKFYEGISKK